MDPLTMMTLLFVALPLAAVLAFCVPCYMGIWAGLYWVYEVRKKPNPMPAIKYETSQVWDQFLLHVHVWQENASSLNMMDFAVPLFLPVTIGAIVGMTAAYGVILYSINIFRVTD